MNTKNTIATLLMATTLVCAGNVNANELAIEDTENTISAVEKTDGSFAFTKAPEVKEQDDKSVTLSWEELPNALGYVVSYGTTSVEKSEGTIEAYDSEVADLIEETEYKIEGLEAGKTYYFAVMALDKNLEETEYSPELEVVMGNAKTMDTPVAPAENMPENAPARPNGEEAPQPPMGQPMNEKPTMPNAPVMDEAPVEALAITNVEAPYSNEIKVTFNKALSNADDTMTEFSIVEKTYGEEIIVAETSLENEDKTVVLTLSEELIGDVEYEITVLALEAQDETNIEAGVEGTRSFTAPKALSIKTEETPVEEEVVEPQDVELNAAAPVETTAEPKNLPQTGAEEVVVLFLAMMLAGMVFIRRKA